MPRIVVPNKVQGSDGRVYEKPSPYAGTAPNQQRDATKPGKKN